MSRNTYSGSPYSPPRPVAFTEEGRKVVIDQIEKFTVNTIVWLRSLPEDELGPSRRMVEDIEAYAEREGGFNFDEVVVGSGQEMLAALAALAVRCREGIRPILHFDCHGSEEAGLLLAPSGDCIGWKELASALRQINIAADNNVCCILGVCFGMYLTSALSVSEPTPYFLTIAPEGEVGVGELEARLPSFYARLFETGNITQAYKDCLADVLSIFHCQQVFAKVFAHYVVNHGSGAAASARRENLITKFLKFRGVSQPTPEQLRSLRAQMRVGVKLNQGLMDHYASIFLIGRKASLSLQDVERLADVYRGRRDARAR